MPADHVVRLGYVTPDGKHGEFIPASKSHKRAASLADQLRPKFPTVRPVTTATDDQFEVLLRLLLKAGQTHMCFDPEPTGGKLVLIADVLRNLRLGRH